MNCNKQYASSQSLCNHRKKIHKNSVSQKSVKISQMNDNVSQMSTKVSHNSFEQTNTNLHINNSLICDYCDKKFAHIQSKWKHERKCKEKNNDVIHYKMFEEFYELKNLIKIQSDELKKKDDEIVQIKAILSDILNKQCEVHPKALQKMNKSLKFE